MSGNEYIRISQMMNIMKTHIDKNAEIDCLIIFKDMKELKDYEKDRNDINELHLTWNEIMQNINIFDKDWWFY